MLSGIWQVNAWGHRRLAQLPIDGVPLGHVPVPAPPVPPPPMGASGGSAPPPPPPMGVRGGRAPPPPMGVRGGRAPPPPPPIGIPVRNEGESEACRTNRRRRPDSIYLCPACTCIRRDNLWNRSHALRQSDTRSSSLCDI
jgi:hypothetical protein